MTFVLSVSNKRTDRITYFNAIVLDSKLYLKTAELFTYLRMNVEVIRALVANIHTGVAAAILLHRVNFVNAERHNS